MSAKNIEEEVVSLQFDNKNFEKNVSTTLSTIDKLKAKLNFRGIGKGFEELDSSVKKVDFSPMDKSLESLKVKFSALDVVAMTALSNIANMAINAGKNIVSALTLDPVMSGFDEYETKINAVQTIMSNTASKGTTMTDVTAVLDELNTYADKTIYNFAEMTRNIGTFTAAGVGLKDSAAAIQGISNLAAASGSNALQASTAMYQLSQALAAGKVQLMDWNSVVNAGMGGEKFQEALKATAREHGIAVDEMIKKNGSFRDSLQEGWITADVLNETLKKFTVEGATEYANAMMESGKWTKEQADALIAEAQSMEDAATKVKTLTQLWDTLKESVQSGWAQTWEILFGNFEEAKELFTAISDSIGGFINAQSQARNELLQGWKDLGGRLELLEALKNVFEAIVSIIKPIAKAFRDIFPPKTAEQLFNLTKGFREFTEKLIISKETSENIYEVFKTLFGVLSLGVNIFTALGKVAGFVIGVFADLLNGVLDVAGAITKMTNSVTDSISTSNTFVEILKTLGELIGSGFQGIIDVGGAFVDNLVDTIIKAFETGDASVVADVLNKTIFASILLTIRKWLSNMTDDIDGLDSLLEKVDEIAGNVSKILDTVRSSLETWQKNLKVNILLKIAAAIGILTASILVLSNINKTKLNDALGALTVLFGELFVAMSMFSKISTTGIASSFSAITMMIGMSTSMVILASALKSLSTIDSDSITNAIYAMGGLMTEMAIFIKVVSSSSGAVLKGATNMIFMATAIKILASACTDISKLDWEGITKGLYAIGGLFVEIGIFVSKANINPDIFVVSLGMITLSGAIKILASACTEIAKLDWNEINKSLYAIGGLFLELSAMSKIIGDSKRLLTGAVAISVVSLMVKSLVEVFEDLKKYSWSDISKSLFAIAGALASVTLAVRGLPADNLLLVSGALPAVTSALVVLAEAMEKFSKLSWDDVIRGIFAAATTMVILVQSLKAMKSVGSGAVIILLASTALLAIATSLAALGAVGIVGVISGIAGLIGVFTTLTLAAKLMKPIIPTMLSLSYSITIFGLSLTALGAGLTVLGTGFITMMTSFVGSVLALNNLDWASLTKGILAMASVFAIIGVSASLLKSLTPSILSLSFSILSLSLSFTAVSGAIALMTTALSSLVVIGESGAKTVVTVLKEILSGLANMLPSIIPTFGDTISSLILTAINVIKDTVPAVIDGFLVTLLESFSSISQYVPQIVDFILTFLIDAINTVATRIPELTEAMFNLIGAIFTSLSEAFSKVDASSLLNGIYIISLLTALTFALNTIKSMIPGAMVGLLGIGAMVVELSAILAAIGLLQQIPGLSWLISEGGEFLETVGIALGRFVGGLAGGFAGGVMNGISGSLPTLGSSLSEFMTNLKPFIEGVKMVDPNTASAVGSLAKAILLITAADVINGITSWLTGGNSMEKFGEQLAPFGKSLKEYSDAVTDIKPDTITASASAAKSLAELANNLPNSGGLVAWFTGSNNIDDFGEMLEPFGKNLAAYSTAVADVKPDAVTASANAAKTLAELANNLPNSGGLFSWFTGNNDIDDFGKQIEKFGKSIKSYAKSVKGLKPESVIASAVAAKSLAELANNLPNSGGLFSWFSGDNTLDDFGETLPAFGNGLKKYAESIAGIDPNTVTASATAAQSLSMLANNLPDSGGIFSWFTGDNNLDDFGEQLPVFGAGLKSYADSVNGIEADSVEASAKAALYLSELAQSLPESGGLFSLFTGDVDLESFGEQLPEFGKSLKSYATAVSGIEAESITGSVSAVGSLAKMADSLPTVGGMASWFVGDNSLSSFGEQLPDFGENVKLYSDSVANISVEDIEGSVKALKSLATLSESIPKIGGMASWFVGDNSIGKFGEQLPDFGEDLVSYSNSVANISVKNIEGSAKAVESLAKLAKNMYETGGIFSWFTGNKETLDEFGETLPDFGTSLNTYATNVGSINAKTLTASATAIDSLIKMLKNMEGLSADGANAFKDSITALNNADISGIIQNYGTNTSQLTTIGQNITKFISEGISSGKTQISTNISTLLSDIPSIFSNNSESFKSIGTGIIDNIISGIDSKKDKPKENIAKLLDDVITAINGYYKTFKTAGKHVVNGFAKGINENTFKAEAKAKEMAKAAADAAKKELDEHSPSRVFGKIGRFAGLGFVNELGKYIDIAKNVGESVGASATSGLNDGISAINTMSLSSDAILSSSLDLGDAYDTINDLSAAFRLQLSADVIANVSALDSMMSQNEQMNSMFDRLSSKLDSTVRSIFEEFKADEDDKVYVIDIHLDTDGREIARTSAKYMKTEIEKIEKRNGRKGGSK